jgi:hypothetical protein
MICGKCGSARLSRKDATPAQGFSASICAECGFAEFWVSWAAAIAGLPEQAPIFAFRRVGQGRRPFSPTDVELVWKGAKYALDASEGVELIMEAIEKYQSPWGDEPIRYVEARCLAAQIRGAREPSNGVHRQVETWDDEVSDSARVRLRSELAGHSGCGSVQPSIDKKALAQYRAKLKEMRDQGYDETDSEFQFILGEVRSASGELAPVGGGEPEGAKAEKGRVRVANAIRRAVGRIEKVCPEAAKHFRLAIKRGMEDYCYSPSEPIHWALPSDAEPTANGM